MSSNINVGDIMYPAKRFVLNMCFNTPNLCVDIG